MFRRTCHIREWKKYDQGMTEQRRTGKETHVKKQLTGTPDDSYGFKGSGM